MEGGTATLRRPQPNDEYWFITGPMDTSFLVSARLVDCMEKFGQERVVECCFPNSTLELYFPGPGEKAPLRNGSLLGPESSTAVLSFCTMELCCGM